MPSPPAPDGRVLDVAGGGVPASAQTATSFTPRARLYTEAMLLDAGSAFAPAEREERLPVMELRFDYADGVVVGARHRPGESRACAGIVRDREGEWRARRLLESFGPTEIGCIDSVHPPLGSRADYVISTDQDPHALCSFSAYALPQLRAFGWHIEIAPDYPWQVVEGEVPLHARIESEDRNWFSLELGIEVDGRRIDLLPALLELLERLPRGGRLDGVVPAGLRGFAVPIGGRRFVTLPAERLRILLKVLSELYQPETGDRRRLRFPALAARALGELEAGFAATSARADSTPGLRWEGAAEALALGQALFTGPARPEQETVVADGLRADLRPYQRLGVAWLQHLRMLGVGGVLADDMGLGKTLQAIAHMAVEKQAGRLDRPALVIAPTSLVGNWRSELARFAPGLAVLTLHGPHRHQLWRRIAHTDVVLTTYAALLRDEDELGRQQFHLLMLDEAQAIKNPRSQVHGAALRLRARHRLCLSGTPVENSLRELWSLFEFLNPGLLGGAEWFAHRYTRPIEREGNGSRLEQLRGQIAPFILRRTKEEVARELPPKTEIWRPVELRGAQRDLYESLRLAGHAEVRRVIADRGIAASTVTILGALMKLRQVCCDPRLLPGEAARGVMESAKYRTLLELLAQQRAAGRHVLVFSQFASMLALIAEGLRGAGSPFVLLTGATRNRQQPIDDFQSGRGGVFLISLKAGGTGLNLTRADTVIHYDPWWNPAVQAQATDRAHRIGQTRPVFVYNLIVAGSVEERMLALQRRKRALALGLLGRADAGTLALSPADVDRLFAPMTGYR
jgi:superfamily II DNA or RNA helicase